jgi:hypothetical protein
MPVSVLFWVWRAHNSCGAQCSAAGLCYAAPARCLSQEVVTNRAHSLAARQSAQVAYLSSVFKYECELKLFFLYELSVRDLPVWTVCLVPTKSRENLEYDKVRGW